ncbi:MAG TPA: polyamine ABC transporter substrate-binding protein [Vibrio sp.]|uniref:polyamine ABC transporter substrate-binding protein n=1 Tax=Vibrio TaxID=662 RepID=UPI0004226507|nr:MULTISPECIES: polyamine ABC transporter substrate-binding protein [Vibrio]HCH00567.1 polyamine ABC transporter substrate-binding protein [Vibrio sp.]
MSFKNTVFAASMTVTTLFTSAALFTSSKTYAQDEQVLHVYNWSSYIAPNTISDFEKQTGIKVVYDVFDSNEVLEAKLLAGRSGYDVVVPSNNFLAKQIRAGVFQKLDRSQLTNWKNLNPELLNALSPSDPGNLYAMPYLWGTIGFAYNIDKVKKALGEDMPTDSWDLVFNPQYMEKLKTCGVSFLDSPTEMLPAALNYLGLDTGTQKPEDIKQAEALFLSIRENISYFHSSKYISDLANGDICVAVGYSNDLFIARDRANEANNGNKIEYVIPKEGAGSYFDMMAIPADAKNVQAAHVFLNYLMTPEVIANITNEVSAANGNQAATPFVNQDINTNAGIYPDEATLKNIYTISDLPAKTQRVMTRTWTKIKTGR